MLDFYFNANSKKNSPIKGTKEVILAISIY